MPYIRLNGQDIDSENYPEVENNVSSYLKKIDDLCKLEDEIGSTGEGLVEKWNELKQDIDENCFTTIDEKRGKMIAENVIARIISKILRSKDDEKVAIDYSSSMIIPHFALVLSGMYAQTYGVSKHTLSQNTASRRQYNNKILHEWTTFKSQVAEDIDDLKNDNENIIGL